MVHHLAQIEGRENGSFLLGFLLLFTELYSTSRILWQEFSRLTSLSTNLSFSCWISFFFSCRQAWRALVLLVLGQSWQLRGDPNLFLRLLISLNLLSSLLFSMDLAFSSMILLLISFLGTWGLRPSQEQLSMVDFLLLLEGLSGLAALVEVCRLELSMDLVRLFMDYFIYLYTIGSQIFPLLPTGAGPAGDQQWVSWFGQGVNKTQQNCSVKMKLTPLESSQTNIRVGLDMMGKIYTNAREWNGKFAELQNQHQYPKDMKLKTRFGNAISNNLAKLKISSQVCGLCQIDKQKTEMEFLCRCHHLYCYSCLNSYVISKIEELTPVKCPQQDCSEIMQLTSNVYRFLPDTVKLKYLQNKHTFKISKEEEANRCQRCLQPKHSGQCKYSLSPNLVENSFRFRECPDCRVEIRLTSGKKKVTCSRCNGSVCYLCGAKWVAGHDCLDKSRIRELERENGYGGCCSCCCDCCSYGCENSCTGCGNCCCRGCGSCCLADCCCQILFSCDDVGPGCCIWNIFSIPVRLVLTVLVIACFLLLFSCVLTLIFFWLLLCLVGGSLGIAMEKVCEARCPFNLLLLLFFPFTLMYGFAVAISETYETPCGILGQLLENSLAAIGSVWEQLSPRKCSY